MNKLFKAAIFKESGSSTEFAKLVQITESQISALVQGHRGPTKTEREKLGKIFSRYQLKKFFAKPKAEKVQGDAVVNE
jgi:hypothetical protein